MMGTYLREWARCTSSESATRRIGELDLRRWRGERLARDRSGLSELAKLALEVVQSIFLLLEAAHLVLVGVRYPLILEVETVELGVGGVKEALELVDLELVLVLDDKLAATVHFLKVKLLLPFGLLLGRGDMLVKRI
jgi:hypothetical protein